MSNKELIKKFNISKYIISSIICGKTRKNIFKKFQELHQLNKGN